MNTTGCGAAAALVLALVAAPASVGLSGNETVMTIPTRGVTEAFLLVRPAGQPVASAILFTGGEGVVGLANYRPGWRGANFLVRNRGLFAEQGLLVAVIEAPSDYLGGLGAFRITRDHARDVAAVLAALRGMAAVPVWVIGTSRGTISAANAAARLTEGGPDGLVLTSTLMRSPTFRGRRVPATTTVDDVDLADIRVPTLIVHHEDDTCEATPIADARALPKRLRRAPRAELITFQGGAPAQSPPCEAFSNHGFWGIDSEVVTAIVAWIKATGRP